MTIEGALPRMLPTAMGGPQVRWPSPPPVAQPFCEDQSVAQDLPPPRRHGLRATVPSLRHQALQNAPAARADTTLPGPSFTDRQLALELRKNFDVFENYSEGGCVTPSSLRQFAAEKREGE